jgi:hypothetical protein
MPGISSRLHCFLCYIHFIMFAMSPTRLWRVGLLVLALFTLSKSLLWGFVNPPLNAGDESAHLMYVMQLRNNGTLPVFKFAPDCSSGADTTPPEPSTLRFIEQSGYARLAPFTAQPYESYQPPLYYLTAALLALPVARDDPLGTLHAGRILSTILVTLTVILAAFAVRRLTSRPVLSLAVAALLASIPVFGFFGGIVSNDPMLNLFAVATLLVALHLVRAPSSMAHLGSILLGALAGGALLSKASGIALIPVGLLAIAFASAQAICAHPGTNTTPTGTWLSSFISALRTPTFWRIAAMGGLLYPLGLLLVDGWMIAYNLREYGDLFGTANTIQYGATCWGPTIASQGAAAVPRYLLSLALLTPFSFLATFGWGDESIGTTAYYVLILPFLLISIYFGFRWLRRRFTSLPPFQQMGLLLMALLTVANIIIWISFNFTIQYQPVGRYLYMAILPTTGFLSIAPLAVAPPGRARLFLFLFVFAALNLLTVLGWLNAGTGFMAAHARG